MLHPSKFLILRDLEIFKARISTMEKRLDILDELEKLKKKESEKTKKLEKDVKNLKKNNTTKTIVVKEVEQFTIEIENMGGEHELTFIWDKTVVAVPFSIK